MKITVRQLKRLIKEAVADDNICINDDQIEIKNRLFADLEVEFADLEEAFTESDMLDASDIQNLLTRKYDFVLYHFVDMDLAEEVKDYFYSQQRKALVKIWQKNKIESLLQKYADLPESLQKVVKDFI